MRKLKIVAYVAAAAVMVGALGYYNFIDKAEIKDSLVGKDCPDFEAQIYAVDGDTFTLSEETFVLSEKLGKVCVINFWETWCTACIKELPEFDELKVEYGDSVEVIALVGVTSTATGETNAAADFWLTNKGWLTTDPNSDWADFSLTFGYLPIESSKVLGYTQSLPRTVVVDQEGKVVYAEDVPVTYDTLKNLVDELSK